MWINHRKDKWSTFHFILKNVLVTSDHFTIVLNYKLEAPDPNPSNKSTSNKVLHIEIAQMNEKNVRMNLCTLQC